jgi:hypothetical protein
VVLGCVDQCQWGESCRISMQWLAMCRILTSSWPTVIVLLLLDATVLQQPVPLPVLHPLDPLNDAGAVALGYVPQPGTTQQVEVAHGDSQWTK